MQKLALGLAISLSLAGQAAAQAYVDPMETPPPSQPVPPPPADGARPGNIIGTGMSLPRSDNAGNINGQTTRSELAPNLPSPSAGDDIQSLLLDARQALQAGRTGEAQEALERASTRALDRSVPAGTENRPAQDPLVAASAEARAALASGDIAGAVRIINEILPAAAMADMPR